MESTRIVGAKIDKKTLNALKKLFLPRKGSITTSADLIKQMIIDKIGCLPRSKKGARLLSKREVQLLIKLSMKG